MIPAESLAGRVALVTGASRGIGAAVALELARQGAHVVASGRTQGALEELDDRIRAVSGEGATLLPLDLAEPGSIDPLGPSLARRFGRLDILVHAAGMLGQLTPVGHIQPSDLDRALAVNVAATWRLIRTCGPVLAAGEAGRAVALTSHRARTPRAYWAIYGASKAAMEQIVLCWADEQRALSPLCINLFDPGAIASRTRSAAFPGEDSRTLRQPADVAPAIVALCGPGEQRSGAIVEG
jgi:NAD(P)-dependent dehydrogenase (short-subunit alcohol dehydrogenase family)